VHCRLFEAMSVFMLQDARSMPPCSTPCSLAPASPAAEGRTGRSQACHSGVDSTTFFSTQATSLARGKPSTGLSYAAAATKSQSNEVMLNEVYMSDEEDEYAKNPSANPVGGVPDFLFGQKMSAPVVLSQSMSCRPVTTAADLQPAMPASVSFCPPRTVPPLQPAHSGNLQLAVPANFSFCPPRTVPPLQPTHGGNLQPAMPASVSFCPPRTVPPLQPAHGGNPQPAMPASVSFCPPRTVPPLQPTHGGNLQPAMPASVSFCPPRTVPPLQPAHGVANGFGMEARIPLAEVDRILRENQLLTEQVTELILSQYPLYAANPVSLRFAVCHELQLLKKLREEQGLPAAESAPTSSGAVPPTSTDLPDSAGETSSGTDHSERGSSVPLSRSSTTPSPVGRSAEGGTKRPAVPPSSITVQYSSAAAWGTNTPRPAAGNQGPPEHFRTVDSLDSFVPVPCSAARGTLVLKNMRPI